jgi:hypothetical protein
MSASSLATDLVTALGLPGCIGVLHPGQITTGNFFWKAATNAGLSVAAWLDRPSPRHARTLRLQPDGSRPTRRDSHASGGLPPAAARKNAGAGFKPALHSPTGIFVGATHASPSIHGTGCGNRARQCLAP